MFCFNTRQDAAYDFIAKSDFDIFCLQEVPARFLERLKELPYHVAFAPDSILVLSPKRRMMTYAVIISRYPVAASGAVRLPDMRAPMRTRLVTSLMKPFGWTKNAGKGFVWADIETPDGRLRVFSLHLTLSSPTNRRAELEIVASMLPENHASIVAGDFNIIDHALMKTLNWFLGSSIRESHPFHRERKHIEERFAHYKFKNPLRGRVTHGISQSQLDHILVPEAWNVLSADVSKKKYGSDHRPVFVEVS
jgi:endonuclease/exonuclease/phosphatase family metal-dependent hydrolase